MMACQIHYEAFRNLLGEPVTLSEFYDLWDTLCMVFNQRKGQGQMPGIIILISPV